MVLKGWELKDVSEKIDGEEYVGFNAVAPESITKDILDCLTVENNTYTLKIEGDDLGESVDTEDLDYLVTTNYDQKHNYEVDQWVGDVSAQR